VQRLVGPGAARENVLLVNPLVEEAGGSRWHAGGQALDDAGRRQVGTLAAWVQGQVAP